MSGMTISAALRRIHKVKGLIAEDRTLAGNINLWAHGEEPPYAVKDVLARIDGNVAELTRLTTAIAVANATHTLKRGDAEITLSEGIKTLGELKSAITWWKALKCMPRTDQMRTVEQKSGYGQPAAPALQVRVLCVIPEPEKMAKVRELQDAFEQLNDALEKRNHEVTI